MSDKCISYSCFLAISGVLFVLSFSLGTYDLHTFRYQGENKIITVTFSKLEPQCAICYVPDLSQKMKTPSLESFIRASTAIEDKELRLTQGEIRCFRNSEMWRKSVSWNFRHVSARRIRRKRVKDKYSKFYAFPQRFRWLKRVRSFPSRFRKRIWTETRSFSIPVCIYKLFIPKYYPKDVWEKW